MGHIIDSKVFLNENIFEYEKRLGSQYSIFLDRTPTFVTYYHINNVNSTTDSGFANVEKILGGDSPLKFQEIKDFPIYGLDQIKLDLAEEEEGLTSGYEGDGIILPNTIKPLPNDFFTISYLDKDYIFMVTAIDYDTIKSNNFYKIQFYFRTLTPGTMEQVAPQIEEKYNCVFGNIGTDDKCLIKSDAYELLITLNKIYDGIATKYKTLFYSHRFNSLLFFENNHSIYDKYLTHFVTVNRVFEKKDEYETMALSNEDFHPFFVAEYDRTIYSAIDDMDKTRVEPMRRVLTRFTYADSIFNRYNTKDVYSTCLIDIGKENYLSDDLISNIQDNYVPDGAGLLNEMVIKYFNNSITSIYALPLIPLQEFKVQYKYEHFLLVPVLLHIIRYYCDKFIVVEKFLENN